MGVAATSQRTAHAGADEAPAAGGHAARCRARASGRGGPRGWWAATVLSPWARSANLTTHEGQRASTGPGLDRANTPTKRTPHSSPCSADSNRALFILDTSKHQPGCSRSAEVRGPESPPAIGPQRQRKPEPTVTPLNRVVHKGEVIPMELLLDHSDDGFDPSNMINHPDDDPVYTRSDPEEDEYKLVEVFGRPELQEAIRKIIYSYKDVFRSTLPSQPARVTPLRIDINTEEWHCPVNQAPHRRQSVSKDIEIYTQVKEMLTSQVIEEATEASAWSQVLLTLKPNGKWRFCIDFRQLNRWVKDRGWPLPRIDEVIDRVGSTHPKYFGKMDLTNGYHQMPLAAESRKWTAFKTAHGLYQWRRVPMGLKNAAAHFQQCMATEVLNGIVNKDCELYIDDILIHAKTEQEFLANLQS